MSAAPPLLPAVLFLIGDWTEQLPKHGTCCHTVMLLGCLSQPTFTTCTTDSVGCPACRHCSFLESMPTAVPATMSYRPLMGPSCVSHHCFLIATGSPDVLSSEPALHGPDLPAQAPSRVDAQAGASRDAGGIAAPWAPPSSSGAKTLSPWSLQDPGGRAPRRRCGGAQPALNLTLTLILTLILAQPHTTARTHSVLGSRSCAALCQAPAWQHSGDASP